MARRAPSTSANTSLHKRKAKKYWWKTPAIAAAAITAIAVILAALINQRPASTSNWFDVPHITQQTHGPASPAIGHVQGNVYFNYGISAEEYDRLRAELGVTDAALTSFFKVLERQQVPREDLDSTLRDIAKQYKNLQEQLQTFTSDDTAVLTLKQAASKALEAGDFAQVETLLNQASQKDLDAAQQFHEIAAKRRLSAAASQAALGALKDTQLRYAEATSYYRRAVELVESIPTGSVAILATYLNRWAEASHKLGDYASAEPRLRQALAIRERVLGPDHPDVATSLSNLAVLHHDQGRYGEAEPLYRRALAISERALGPNHPEVATTLSNLGNLCRRQDRYAEAEPCLQRALTIREQALGPDHPDVTNSLNSLAVLYRRQGRYPEAEPLYRRALAIQERTLGHDHPDVATTLQNYAVLLKATNRVLEADELETRAKTIRAKYSQDSME